MRKGWTLDDLKALPLNRAAGNAECFCGFETVECPFTPIEDDMAIGTRDLCIVCSQYENDVVHGPADRCHGSKRHRWTLGDGGCEDPSEHHSFDEATFRPGENGAQPGTCSDCGRGTFVIYVRLLPGIDAKRIRGEIAIADFLKTFEPVNDAERAAEAELRERIKIKPLEFSGELRLCKVCLRERQK